MKCKDARTLRSTDAGPISMDAGSPTCLWNQADLGLNPASTPCGTQPPEASISLWKTDTTSFQDVAEIMSKKRHEKAPNTMLDPSNGTFQCQQLQSQKYCPNKIQGSQTLGLMPIWIAYCSHPPKNHDKIFLYFYSFVTTGIKFSIFLKVITSF